MDRYIPKLPPTAWHWVRFAALVTGLVLLLGLLYGLTPVLTPLLLAFALAYILNPVVTWFEQRHRVARLTTTIVVFSLAALLFTGGGIYAVTATMGQLITFQARLPIYVERIGTFLTELNLPQGEWIGAPTTAPDASAEAGPTTPPGHVLDWWQAARPYLQEHGTAVAGTAIRTVQTVFSNIATIATLFVLVPMFAFYFLWRFNDMMAAVRDHLPVDYRPTIVHIVQTADEAIANFFRGRLIVSLLVGLLSAIGWTLVGVPYSVPLGLLAGLFNLVPFLSILALPLALLSAYAGALDAGTAWTVPLILTMGVFLAVQALESFLLSPAIEGQASGLHPLVIVVALLIGAQLAGLLGMLLAIPVTSTLKVLGAQYVLPEVRRLAGVREPLTDEHVTYRLTPADDAAHADTAGNDASSDVPRDA
ncbi:MAG: AI-2E family transporter [Phycisphaerales bacterium]|nr:AI-2E family transporter [Phycisphaerales bacterium]